MIRLQGGSVVATYLKKPEWKIRAITRDPSKPAAKKREAQGVAVVKADLDDADSLVAAFKVSRSTFSCYKYLTVSKQGAKIIFAYAS
jgi:hypothetical protein